ncbi:MAG: OmpA family protein [Chromatiaceae bacterium]|jgi:OOP family OmpA-OmpF porin
MFESAGKKKFAAVLAPVGLVFGLTSGVAYADSPDRFVTSAGDGTGVTVSGECLRTIGGTEPENCVEPEPMMVDGDDDLDGVPNSRDACPATPRGARVDSRGCQIIDSVVINVTADHFAFDSAELKPKMKDELDTVVARIQGSRGNEMLQVVGHTDSTGPEAYNQGLSERRAQAAADYLASQGIDASMMTVKGMGESVPVADNASREGRAMNRRVEIVTQ